MSVSAFIRGHHEAIISEFTVFDKTLMPPGTDMTEAQLRDHAEYILTAVVEDIGIPQSLDEQSVKSRGRGSAKTMAASGKLHADDRIQHGFTFRSVLAEFRALRATVLRMTTPGDRTSLRCADSTKRLTSSDGVDGSLCGAERPVSGSVHRRPRSRPAHATRSCDDGGRAPRSAGGQSATTRVGCRAHHEQRPTHGADDPRSLGPDAPQVGGIHAAHAKARGPSAGMRGGDARDRCRPP